MPQIIPPDVAKSNQPLSEQYRLAGIQWVKLDGAARGLEELKSIELEERKNALVEQNPGMADTHAKRQVTAMPEWRAWIKVMVDTRTAANHAKIELEAIKMEHWEHQSHAANQRSEMKL